MADGFSFQEALNPPSADNAPAPTGFGWDEAQHTAPAPEPRKDEVAPPVSSGSSLGRIARAGLEGAKQGWSQSDLGTILSPEAQAKLDAIQSAGGITGRLAGIGSTAAADIGAGLGAIPAAFNTALGAYQGLARQTGEETGHPLLGEAAAIAPAALMEAFPQEAMGLKGVLEVPPHVVPGSHAAIERDVAKARADIIKMHSAPEGADSIPPPAAPVEATPPAAPIEAAPQVAITPEQRALIEEAQAASPPPVVNKEPEAPPPPPATSHTVMANNPASNFVNMRPEDLKVDPERFQYKASDEKGVTGALQGVTKWEPALANPITAWHSSDGNTYVVNGHQRHDLATRAQAAGQPDVQIPTRVFWEQDGYTPEFMKALGAYQNIAEGSGTPVDAAKVLRGAGSIPDSMALPSLPPKSAMVQQAQSLAKLSPNAFGMVENGLVQPAYAAHVGDLITDPKQQEAALGILSRAEPPNSTQARMMVQDIRNSGFIQGVQGGLFGDEAFAKSLIPERAKILDGSMQNLRRTRGLYKAAVEGESELSAVGNQLNPEANVKAKTDNEHILEVLQREATNKGPISDALNSAAKDLADGKPRASIQSAFLNQVRKIIARGEDAGVQHGDLPGGEGSAPAPRIGEPIAPPPIDESSFGFEQARLPKPPAGSEPDLFGAQKAAPAQRAPEPTIKADVRQQEMPGMERSAVQAQAARDAEGPKSGQLPADQGLFARPETPQPELLPKPRTAAEAQAQFAARQEAANPRPDGAPVSRWMNSPNAPTDFRDLLHTIPDRFGGHQAAENWVRERGSATGHEHIAVVDNATGEIVHAGTQSRPGIIGMDPTAFVGDRDAYTVHHNHPLNLSLSGSDIGYLAFEGVQRIYAHGGLGDTYSAALGPLHRDARATTYENMEKQSLALRQIYKEATNTATQIARENILSLPDRSRLRDDIVNRILHDAGHIDYSTTKNLPHEVTNAIERQTGNSPRSLPSDRSAERVQPDAGTSELHQRGNRRAEPEPSPNDRGSGSREGNASGEYQNVGRGEQELHEEQPEQPRARKDQEINLEAGPQFDVLRDKQGMRRAAAEIQALLSPTSLKGAKPTEAKLRKHGAELAQSYAQSSHALEAVRDAIDKLPKEAQLDFTDRMERGLKQASPELDQVATALRQQLDAWARKVQGLGRGYLSNAIKDYMGHVWGNYNEWAAGKLEQPTEHDMQQRAAANAGRKSPLLGSGAFLRERTFPTQAEGIEAGLIPVTYNPVDLQLLKIREMQKYYHGLKLADQMKDTGIARWVRTEDERSAQAAGMDKLDDRIFQPRLTGEANPAGFGRLEPGNWYAPEPAARIFNNHMSRGLAGQSVIFDTTRAAGNALNLAQLSLSAFHATFVALDTMKSQFALGVQQTSRGAFGKAAISFASGITPYSLYDTVRTGSKLRTAWLDPENASPRWQQLAKQLNEVGGRISMDQFYRSNASGPLLRSLGDLKDPRAILGRAMQTFADEPTMMRKALLAPLKIVGRVLETATEPLMGQLVPRAKLGVFAKMAEDWQEAHMDATPEQRSAAMIKMWDSVDNRLGQMVYDNLFWNKTQKDLAFISTRSVGWNLGTIRELGGAAVDTGQMIRDIAHGRKPELTSRMAYAIAMPIVTALYGSILNYLATGKSPQGTLDLFFPQTGTTDANGNPERRNIPGYEKDVLEYYHAPVQTLLNKTNPLLETGMELYRNQDYYGGIIRDPQRDAAIPAYADYLLNQTIPFSWRGWNRLHDEHASMGDQALAFWGFQPSPKSITAPDTAAAYQNRQNTMAYKRREREPGRMHFFLPNPKD